MEIEYYIKHCHETDEFEVWKCKNFKRYFINSFKTREQAQECVDYHQQQESEDDNDSGNSCIPNKV